MKLPILFIILYCVSLQTNAQWDNFNEVIPISWQDPSFTYYPQGHFTDVYTTDFPNNYFGGYLLLGRGILCHPDSTLNRTKCFSVKINREGELLYSNRYDQVSDTLTETWSSSSNSWILPQEYGHSIMNRKSEIVSPWADWSVTNDNYSEAKSYLVFLDLFGNMLRKELFDSSWAHYMPIDIAEDVFDSTYVLCGRWQDSTDIANGGGTVEGFTLKLDSLGNHIWQQRYDSVFQCTGITQAMDGGFWLCGMIDSIYCYNEFNGLPYYDKDVVLIKTNNMGQEMARVNVGALGRDFFFKIHESAPGKVLLAGRIGRMPICNSTYYQNGGNNLGAVYTRSVTLTASNQLILEPDLKTYAYVPSPGDLVDLHVIGKELLIASNTFMKTDSSQNSNGIWVAKGTLLKLDENRDSVWMKGYSYYTAGYEGELSQNDSHYAAWHFILDSKPTPDGGWVCAGYVKQGIYDPLPWVTTPWVFKVDSMGCLEPGCQFVTQVEEIVIGLENTLKAYPNPTRDYVYIDFELPPGYNDAETELIVLDLMGREVARQTLSPSAFISPVQVDLTQQPPGVYILHWVNQNKWYDSIKVVKE
jgi:hypothetical protein